MKQSILVVDDNENIRTIVKKSLEKDFNVLLAENGQEALEKLSSNEVSLIILDLTMPVLDGIEVLKHLKKNEKINALNIIILSARNGTKERERAYKLGVKNFIEKPFSPSELLAIVNSFAEEKLVELSLGELRLIPDQFVAYKNNVKIEMTPQEYKILEHMVRNKGILLTRERILEDVFKGREDLSDRNVDTHVSNIRKKISHTNVQIKTIYGQGYQIITT